LDRCNTCPHDVYSEHFSTNFTVHSIAIAGKGFTINYKRERERGRGRESVVYRLTVHELVVCENVGYPAKYYYR
jgi:hypothetical protein